jgi:outer membrane lipoprotein SlyB
MDAAHRSLNCTLAAALALALGASAGSAALAQLPPPRAERGAPPPAARVCTTCGVVEAVRQHESRGNSSGVGAVAGGVLGGVLGHQIGSGRGNTLATIAGAGAGAYAGNEIEKNRNRKSYWTVALRMDDGRRRTFTYSSRPAVRQGDHVKLVDGGRRLALLAR